MRDQDGYPPRKSNDLERFVASDGALGSWVAIGNRDGGEEIIGQVALHPRSSDEVMTLAARATGRSWHEIAVVARLFVSPDHRRMAAAQALLAVATKAAHDHRRWPILDVAMEFDAAQKLYLQNS